MNEVEFLTQELTEALEQLKRDVANLERRLSKNQSVVLGNTVTTSAIKVDSLLAQLKLAEKVDVWK